MASVSACCVGDSPFLGDGAGTVPALDSENSCQSNHSCHSSPGKKRRRRAENEMLMEDLLSIDSSLAATVTEGLKASSKQEKGAPAAAAEGSTTAPAAGDSPAQHLRPRRNIRPPSSAALYTITTPGSLLSPVLQWRPGSAEPSPARAPLPEPQPTPPAARCQKSDRLERCVLQNVDCSVFAPLLPPGRLDTNNLYQYNYVALRITEVKPLRYVNLSPGGQPADRLFRVPVLELLTVDCQDRFQVDYMRGIFDHDQDGADTSPTPFSVFLLGSYAVQSEPVASKGAVINIVSFRTSLAVKGAPARHLKKRKLVSAVAAESGFCIIVDSPQDSLRWEPAPDPGSPDPFAQMYEESVPPEDERDWLPLVSYCQHWKPPTDPRELNRSLYIIQPCIAKFESSSRTVKMSSVQAGQ